MSKPIQPTAFGMGTNQSNSGVDGGYDPIQQGLMSGQIGGVNGIDYNIQKATNPVSSAFSSIMGPASMGSGGFLSSLPGYAISAFSAYDQNKTNKLNRKLGNQQYAFNNQNQERYNQFHDGMKNLSWKG